MFKMIFLWLGKKTEIIGIINPGPFQSVAPAHDSSQESYQY